MSGFRVAGTLDGVLYEVEVTGRKSRPTVGSKRVAGLVRQHEGDTVLVTPVGPAYVVDGEKPETVLALLSAHTQVHRVSDDAPQLVDPRPVDGVW
jgi:hypothetical protein